MKVSLAFQKTEAARERWGQEWSLSLLFSVKLWECLSGEGKVSDGGREKRGWP